MSVYRVVSPDKTAELIVMLFRGDELVGPKKPCHARGADPPRGRSNFCGLPIALKSTGNPHLSCPGHICILTMYMSWDMFPHKEGTFQGCTLHPILELKYSQNPNFGEMNMHVKSNAHNIKICIFSNLLHRI